MAHAIDVDSLAGCREIKAAEARVANAKSWNECACKLALKCLEPADDAQLEYAQAQVRLSAKEVKDAEASLLDAHKRWEVIDVDKDDNDPPKKKQKTNKEEQQTFENTNDNGSTAPLFAGVAHQVYSPPVCSFVGNISSSASPHNNLSKPINMVSRAAICKQPRDGPISKNANEGNSNQSTEWNQIELSETKNEKERVLMFTRVLVK